MKELRGTVCFSVFLGAAAWQIVIMATWYVEQRKWPRLEINAPGKIVMITRRLRVRKEIGCIIVDISEGGAQLAATSPIDCDEFYLEMNETPGRLRLCSVVRRLNDSRVGVRFV